MPRIALWVGTKPGGAVKTHVHYMHMSCLPHARNQDAAPAILLQSFASIAGKSIRRASMELEKTYPSLLTADLAAAERWYTALFGRGPDYRPMPTLLHWELSEQGGLMLSSSEEIASRGSLFLYVADLAAERRRLEKAGIAFGEDILGDYSTLAQARDPDGNLITLASPPSRPFPSA